MAIMEESRRNNCIFAMLLIILITEVFLFFYFFVPIQKQEIKMDIKATSENIVGFNVETDALHFGTIKAGLSASRNIELKGDEKFFKIKIKPRGDFAEWVHLSENNFVLSPYEMKNISVSVHVPLNTEPKAYNGTLIIYSYRTW